MHPSITRLTNLAHKERCIVGLMSGTSLDGLDIAVCKIKGHGLNTQIKLEHFTTVEYPQSFVKDLQKSFAKPKAELAEITRLHALIARVHASILLKQLKKWQISPTDIDLIASHGQTMYHAPNSLSVIIEDLSETVSATLQLGDGDHLASLSGILTLSDFRQKHVAMNGEGAPLVPYVDYLLFTDKAKNRVLLNIGGIANYTFLPAAAKFSHVRCQDTGAGNTLMDQYLVYAKAKGNTDVKTNYDKDGAFAAQGSLEHSFLARLLALRSKMQKANSTGQELFNLDFIKKAWSANNTATLPFNGQAFFNILATLNMFSAQSIADSIVQLTIKDKLDLYVSGGGAHNTCLLNNLKALLPKTNIFLFDNLGMPADAKEAALFAVLANQSIFGDNTIFSNHPSMPATSFGKLCLP